MSVHYQAIGWNPQKRIYDAVLVAGTLAGIGLFVALGGLLYPDATAETLLIRALGVTAFVLLHVILCIGPLARLDRKFLPLLYNRRHAGVTMFILALAHSAFSVFQFHALGNINPLVSVLASNTRFGSISQFPFQQLGLAALVVLFLLAATSHDFWLNLLTPRVWKRLHMFVYLAYFLLVAHVALGSMQSERIPAIPVLLGLGAATVSGLHFAAARKEHAIDRERRAAGASGFVDIGAVDEIPDQRAKVVSLGGERVAVFRYGELVSAISNVCRHQNGPLGEGRIVDGCVTCPWHGYQYLPDTGASPPPFTEKVETYDVKVIEGRVLVHPKAHDPGTKVEPARISRRTAR